MLTSITIPDLPDDVVAVLTARANVAGLSLAAYVRAELLGLARGTKTAAEWVAEVSETKGAAGAHFSREEIAAYREFDRR